MRRIPLLILFASASLLAQETTVQPADFMESWARWSRDTMKAWQEAKVLHGNDLDKAKRLAGGIETKWTRLKKADQVADVFNCHLRDDEVKLIDALNDKSRKWTKIALQNLRSDLNARLKPYTSRRQLLYEIGGDLESLRLLMDSRLNEAKDLKSEKKKVLETHVTEVDVVGKAASAASQWCDGVGERINKAIGTIEEWLEELR
jgi:hypothetical protein